MANRIKGITIEIDGDVKGLTDSLKDVDSSLKDTQSKLRDVNKLLKLDPSNVELLRQKHDLLTKAVEDTKKRQEQLKIALEQAQNAGSTAKAREQQDALQRELFETTESLKDLQKQAGNALTPQLQSVSEISGQVAEKTKGISTAAGIAAAGMLAMAGKAAATADDLLTMSNVTGFSVEELQKMQYASSFVDVSMETMTGSITKLTNNMASGSEAFDKLGVSITNEDGSMRDATEVWYDSLEALSQVENGTERDQLAMDLFGRSAMEMAGIVDDGGQALKDLGADAEATGNILSQDAVEDAVAFNDQIDELKGKAEQAFLSAGAALADTLVPALETLVDVITGVLSWFGQLDGGTQAFILTVLGLVAAISPIAGLISTITGLASALNVAMLPMIGTIGGIVLAIGAAVAIGVALYQNWDTIKEKAGELWENIKTTFENIKNSIGEKLDSAKEKVRNAIDTIKGFFNFQWSLPSLKMPHITATGGFSLVPPSVPKFSIDWYDKAMDKGMILNGATIFGAMNGKLLGGGESGSELVIGTDSLMAMIQKATRTVNAPIDIKVNVAGNVDDPNAFGRQIGQTLAEMINRESEVFA